MLVMIVLALGLLAAMAWFVQSRSAAAVLPDMTGIGPASTPEPPADVAADPGTDAPARLAASNARAATRLWGLAFSTHRQASGHPAAHRHVRDNIMALLEVDSLNPRFFPRRPTLMSQLLQAVDDPQSGSTRISRMIAHDPVLTADVLRLANSRLYRASATPVESIQRAIVTCGVDALRGMLAIAMMRPVFRATAKNFPRFPRMLWERTARAARAAELHALATHAPDRFEAQLVTLLRALGPLVVYSAALDVYARNPHLQPNADLCVELIDALGPGLAVRLSRDWENSVRIEAALAGAADEPLTAALHVGELLGTLSLLESQRVIVRAERDQFLTEAGIGGADVERIWAALPD